MKNPYIGLKNDHMDQNTPGCLYILYYKIMKNVFYALMLLFCNVGLGLCPARTRGTSRKKVGKHWFK